MTVVTDGAPIPELIVGTNRYDSVCWDPNGITLSVVTNRSGILTDLAAPRAGVPVIVSGVLKDDTTQTAKRGGVVQAQAGTVYDYSAINAVGLTNVLTRSTGLFKGTFKAWFDYPATHTYRSISYEGVLTPEREDMGDGIEGRGFFLWADKTVPPMSPYNFNWSYDFKIQSAPANP